MEEGPQLLALGCLSGQWPGPKSGLLPSGVWEEGLDGWRGGFRDAEMDKVGAGAPVGHGREGVQRRLGVH